MKGPGFALLAATSLSISALAVGAVRCQAPPIAPAVRTGLAPTGTLRAAINLGNAVLATRDAATGGVRGVSVDLSRELARRLGVPVELVVFTSAGKVVEEIGNGSWDVACVGVDPARAAQIEFSEPFVEIEGAYLVSTGSALQDQVEVDRDDVRVVVGKGSVYDLYLTRELKHARIVRAPTSPEVTDAMVAQRLDVAAGVRQQLEADARRLPGLRLLTGRFMVIRQAMATPKGRGDAGARYLSRFVEEMKASGFVAAALARHGIADVTVAPASIP